MSEFTNENRFPRVVEIEVTREDLENAERYTSNEHCLLATAAKRALNRKAISCGTYHLDVWSGRKAYAGRGIAYYEFSEADGDRIKDAYHAPELLPFTVVAERVR